MAIVITGVPLTTQTRATLDDIDPTITINTTIHPNAVASASLIYSSTKLRESGLTLVLRFQLLLLLMNIIVSLCIGSVSFAPAVANSDVLVAATVVQFTELLR